MSLPSEKSNHFYLDYCFDGTFAIVEKNEKYKKYSENFEDIVNKTIIAEKQRKSINKNQKYENNENNEKIESNVKVKRLLILLKKLNYLSLK